MKKTEIKDTKEIKEEIKPYGFFIIHTHDLELAKVPIMNFADYAPMACSIAEILPKLWQICTSLDHLAYYFDREVIKDKKDIIEFKR